MLELYSYNPHVSGDTECKTEQEVLRFRGMTCNFFRVFQNERQDREADVNLGKVLAQLDDTKPLGLTMRMVPERCMTRNYSWKLPQIWIAKPYLSW